MKNSGTQIVGLCGRRTRPRGRLPLPRIKKTIHFGSRGNEEDGTSKPAEEEHFQIGVDMGMMSPKSWT